MRNAPRTAGSRTPVTVRLEPEIHSRLFHLADADARTLSAMAERLIAEALNARDEEDNA